MKLITIVIFSIAIMFAITVFQNTGTVDVESGNINISQVGNSDSSYFWNWMLDPSNWNEDDTSGLIGFIITVFIVSLGVSVIASFFKSSISDAMAFIPIVSILLGVGAPAVIMLYNFIKDELSPIMCGLAAGSPTNCLMAVWIAIFFSASLAGAWFFSVLKWWRTGFVD